MEKLDLKAPGVRELSRDELKTVIGGGGGLMSFVLGVSIFGMARMCGVIVGRASL